MTYQVVIVPTALKLLKAISNRATRQRIMNRIAGLRKEPEKQGKPLTGDLAGFRSLRAAGQRYRIIYQIQKGKVTVIVVAVGIRKEGSKEDIYTLARKLLRLGLVIPP